MAKVEIVKEMLNNHSDEEIIAYLDKVLSGAVMNYQTALKSNQPEALWGNLGDLTMVATILRALKQRNEAREATKQNMV